MNKQELKERKLLYLISIVLGLVALYLAVLNMNVESQVNHAITECNDHYKQQLKVLGIGQIVYSYGNNTTGTELYANDRQS